MAFVYHSDDGNTLTKSQEDILETIENLPFPFGGISKFKDLRSIINLVVCVSEGIDWESYMSQYTALHDEFYGGKHAPACHRHQGEIGFRRNFAEEQIRRSKEPKDEFLPLLGLYSRTYQWWKGRCRPKVGLIADSIEEYALKADLNEDIVFGIVFIQEMMHAYFDSFNSKGYPSIEPLEESFAEFAMLAFIDQSPAIRGLLPYAKDYVISRIGKEPRGFGYGIELFERAGEDATKLIRRYRKISNWTEPPFLYKNSYADSMRKYEADPSEENADKVYEDIIEILNKDWEQPFDPIQPAIGEPWDFDR